MRDWLRDGRNRMKVHGVFAALWLVAAIVVPWTPLKDSTGYVIFLMHVGLGYAAVSALIGEWAGRKADPEDPA